MFRVFLFAAVLRLAAGLPYNPSYIWTSISQDNPVAYSLVPGSSKTDELQFRSIKLSKPFDVDSPPFSKLPAPPLPDDDDNDDIDAMIPASDGDGMPIIYTGNCQTDNASVWHFKVDNDDGDGEDGTWSISPVRQGDEETELKGPNYLASAITFPSSDQDSMPSIFVFGGMCPTTIDGSDTWVSAANYSRSMLSLRADTAASDTEYSHAVLSIRSPPVAEAGFSMTPLLPAYSNSSTGKQTRQQGFVLIGGHTQNAFINMSQVALFSLPEESWNYVLAEDDTESSSRQDQGLEPRSGHTAVLTADGSKIIVFGGWVGDISVPAEPQLAILNLGEEYGGSGDWEWSVPESSPNGLRKHTGIFGHGATMLPGDIMLVIGGYEIPERSAKRSSPQLNPSDQVYLLNTTSGTWMTSYTAPKELTAGGDSKGPLSSTSQKTGLGVGVGVGVPLAALSIFCIIYFFRNRQTREHKKSREQALRNLALGAERPHFEPPETDGSFSPMRETESRQQQQPLFSGAHDGAARSYYENNDNWAEDTPSAAERTGLLVEVPSPTRGLRPNARAKTHQSAPFQDDPRKNIKFSRIHPIDEGEEYYGVGISQPKLAAGQRDSKNSGFSDPFRDPPSPSKTLFPSLIPQDQGDDSRVQSWRHTVGNDGEYVNPPHMVPSDDQERTLSNISGNSGSGQSTSSHQTNTIPLQRNPSHASRINTPPFDAAINNPRLRSTEADRNLYDGRSMADRPQSQVSFGELQAESGSLLGLPPIWMDTRADSPTKSSTSTRTKAMEWAGSVRRALSLLSKNEDAGRSQADMSDPIRETRRLQRSLSSSPAKSFYSAQEDRSQGSGSAGSINLPRRAVSTSSSALRLKQGAKDWNAKRSSAESSTLLRSRTYAGPSTYDQASSSGGRLSRSSGSLGNEDYDYDDEDWDVEAAAEGRVVQVTYTVPKEKLRVVNAGAGDNIDDNDDDNRGNGNRDRDRDSDGDDKGFPTPSNPTHDNGEGSSKHPPPTR